MTAVTAFYRLTTLCINANIRLCQNAGVSIPGGAVEVKLGRGLITHSRLGKNRRKRLSQKAGGALPSSKKTSWIAEQSILKFCYTHQTVYYWTFTFAENVQDKLDAEKRFKAFRDMIKRRGGEELHFWELQKRGAWHVHLLTDKYLDVVWLRDWLMKRGWGPQMRVERVASRSYYDTKKGWVNDDRNIKRLIWYLRKYLTKSLDESADKKKAFGGSAIAKVGTTRFKWMPNVNPYSYLYYYGARALYEIFSETPTWMTVGLCIRLGYEYCNWGEIDPFFIPT